MDTLKIAVSVVVLGLVLLFVWSHFRRERNWVTSGHTYEGFPLYLRRPINVDTPANRKRYTQLVMVSHEFMHRYPDGRPELDYNESLEDFDLTITSAFDSPPCGVPILVETFGGFRRYYFCVAPEADIGAIIQPITQAYPFEKLTWKHRETPACDFLPGYAERYSTDISPPVSFRP